LNLEIEKAYGDLKASLAQKGCKTVSENPPTQLLVKQGSLWGVSPTSAKKIVNITCIPIDSGTQVTCSSSLSPDWKNITILGCALAAVLIGLCLWMAFGINAFIANGKATFWSWLATVDGTVDLSVARLLVNLTEALAVFLFIIIISEVAVAVYAHGRIDWFAQEILDSL